VPDIFVMVADTCSPCSKLVTDDISCFEPEAGPYLVEGLNFHKFYFNNGKVANFIRGYIMLLLIQETHQNP